EAARGLIWVFVLAAILLHRYWSAQGVGILERIDQLVLVWLPTGWPGWVMNQAALHGRWEKLLLAVPAAALCYAAWKAKGRLEENYRLVEEVHPDSDADGATAFDRGAEAAPVGVTEIVDGIHGRGFLAAPDWRGL